MSEIHKFINTQMRGYNRSWGYARVSDFDKQAVEGYSLEAQHNTIKKYVEFRQTTSEKIPPLGGIYSEPGVPAWTPFLERPVARELNKKMRRGDHLIFYKLDRGFRNPLDCLQMMMVWSEAGIKVHFMDIGVDTSTPLGEMLVTLLAGLARWDNRIRSERIKQSVQVRKMLGLQVSNWPGFGMKFVKVEHLGKMRRKAVEDPQQWEAMRLIYEWRRLRPRRMTRAKIADELNARGYLAMNDKPWDRTKVMRYEEFYIRWMRKAGRTRGTETVQALDATDDDDD